MYGTRLAIMTENTDPTIKFCPACGADVLAGARFCVACRQELPEARHLDQPGEDDKDAPPGDQTEYEYCEACGAEVPADEVHVSSHDQMRIAADRGYGKEIAYHADLMIFEKKKAFRELVDQGAERWRLCHRCQTIFLGYLKKRRWRPW